MDHKLKELLNKWRSSDLTAEEARSLLHYCKDQHLQPSMEEWLYQLYNADSGNTGTPLHGSNPAYFTQDQKKDIFTRAIRPQTPANTAAGDPVTSGDDGGGRNQVNGPSALLQIPPFLPEKGPGTRRRQRRRSSRWLLRTAVACCLIGCCLILVQRFNRQPAPDNLANQALQNDITAPLAATPTIRWGQGTDPMAVDKALQMQAARVHRDQNGTLVFKAAETSSPPSTIAVPRGSRPVHVQLPDGSQVWINTGSTLQFPAAFSDSRRTVSLTGEAYFEVVHNSHQVFEVQQGDNTVTVLGTHFNINAYADNPTTKITLLEGRVQINHASYLSPAEQAVLDQGKIQVYKNADLQQVMAWKNNQFYFKGNAVPEILRQLARWYNLNLIYKGAVPEGHYSGIISKDNSLSQVLSILEAGGLKFKLNKHTLWIY